MIVERASGFVYYVSITGITGTRSADIADIGHAIKRLRRHTDLPIGVGFGIKTPEQAAEVASVADAAVVGSAFVDIVAANLDDAAKARALACVRAIRPRLSGKFIAMADEDLAVSGLVLVARKNG